VGAFSEARKALPSLTIESFELIVIAQWLHVMAAVVAVGGVAFVRFVLLPASESMADEQRQEMMGAVVDRFRKILWISIGLLLITGLYNVDFAASNGSLASKPYLYGLIAKIVIALVVFKIGFMLTVPGDAFASIKANRKKWLMINFVLGMVVVLIAAYLRRFVGGV
jgi:uncharacterized membrane protein